MTVGLDPSLSRSLFKDFILNRRVRRQLLLIVGIWPKAEIDEWAVTILLSPGTCWIMTHGNGNWKALVHLHQNRQSNTLLSVVTIQHIAQCGEDSNTGLYKHIGKALFQSWRRQHPWCLIKQAPGMIFALSWCFLCHNCGDSIINLFFFFYEYAQSFWMMILSYFKYHIVFPNDSLTLMNMLLIGHPFRNKKRGILVLHHQSFLFFR